jgi:hypothetical protein
MERTKTKKQKTKTLQPKRKDAITYEHYVSIVT